jgi:hypothetical protein
MTNKNVLGRIGLLNCIVSFSIAFLLFYTTLHMIYIGITLMLLVSLFHVAEERKLAGHGKLRLLGCSYSQH